MTTLRVVLLLTVGLVGVSGPAVGQTGVATGHRLPLAEGSLFYEVVGAGDAVVVVHGGPGLDHAYLRPGLDILANSLSLVYYDQRGTGRSEGPLGPDAINLDAFVGDIDRLREALGLDEVTVLGHSFGGLIAMAYALEHPESTRALLLLNTVEPGPRWRDEAASRAAAARTSADASELEEITGSPGFAERDPAVMSRLYRVAYRGTFKDRSRVEELNLELAANTARDGPDVARLLGESLGDVDWWDRLSGLDVPTLVVHGRFDPTPVEMAEALVETLPSGRLALLESGHFPYVEAPGELVRVVRSFLAGVER
jgi:proline iminopeptidase